MPDRSEPPTEDRPRLVYADGADGPLPDPEEVAALAGVDDPELLLGWVMRTPGWMETTPVPITTMLTGPGTRKGVAAGRIRSAPTRLSGVPRLFAGRLRPTVAVVGAHEDGDGGWRLAHSPGWAGPAARHAEKVVVERWLGPPLPGAPALDGRVVGVLERVDPPDPPPANAPGPAHARIGELVAGLIPDGATIQWGPGVIGASVVAALRSTVRVRSGLVTDELVALDRAGRLLGTADAAYLWGSAELEAMIGAGKLALSGVEQIHDLTAISAVDRFVAINTALQVGLDGAVNVESVGGRVVAGPGGHPDFSAGASRSAGGLAVVALVATAGGRSNIVVRPDGVSTPRTDVDVVVTEHGVADLRGLDDAGRAARLIAVAAPEHRDELAAALPAAGATATTR